MRPAAVHGRRFGLPEAALDAAVQRSHHLVAAAGGGRVVEAHLAGVDAEAVPLANLVEQSGALQQRLGGDAAAVQAGAAHLVRLNDGGAQAQLPGADGGDIAAGAPAQDDDVKALWHAAEYRSAHLQLSPRLGGSVAEASPPGQARAPPRTTKLPAILSCQPCLRGSKPTQMRPM